LFYKIQPTGLTNNCKNIILPVSYTNCNKNIIKYNEYRGYKYKYYNFYYFMNNTMCFILHGKHNFKFLSIKYYYNDNS